MALKPEGCSLSEFEPLFNNYPAEKLLLEKCRSGEFAIISAQRPDKPTKDNTIRASFLRFLALGGDENAPVHERGVFLRGAWIKGELNLEGLNVHQSLSFTDCYFENTPILKDSHIRGFLSFIGSEIDGLRADRMRCSSSVFLRKVISKNTVRFISAYIDGDLDCRNAAFQSEENDYALACDNAIIKGSVFLNKVNASSSICFIGAEIDSSFECDSGTFQCNNNGYALLCDNAIIKGNVFLRDNFKATGEIRLLSAQIGGLECIGNAEFHSDLIAQGAVIRGRVTSLDSHFKKSVDFSGVQVDGNIYIRDSIFDGKNSLSIEAAQIGGNLICQNTQFKSTEGFAIHGERAVIKGSIRLCGGFTTASPVLLSNTQIGSFLDCTGAVFNRNQDNRALMCEGAEIRGSVILSNISAKGSVSLSATQIGSELVCQNSKFYGDGTNALRCDNAVIEGTVFLDSGFEAFDTVRLINAQIGELACSQAKFVSNRNSTFALLCDGLEVKHNVFFNDGFKAIGTVRLVGAKIGGNLECRGDFNGNGESALECDSLVVDGILFKGNFSFVGEVSLKRVKIGVGLECSGGTGTFSNGTSEYALNAEGMEIANMFHFSNIKLTNGKVSLAYAKVGTLIDDSDSWSKGQLILDGFVYERFGGEETPTDAKTRIAWLNKQIPAHLNDKKEFKPQPWQQLQKVLREMGHLEDARQVAIAFEKQLLKAKRIRHCILHRLFGLFIGYGYRPFRLFIIMMIVWLLCGGIYWCAALYGDEGHGVFSPSNPLVFQNSDYAVCVPNSYESTHIEIPYRPIQGAGNWYLCEKLREEYTGFSPIVYSLDLILPLVDLQQERDWSPMIPTPNKNPFCEFGAHTLKHITRLVMWFEILFGWVASLLLVAVVSGLTKRREE